jgi:4-carboxymuconolactone decarboxylase
MTSERYQKGLQNMRERFGAKADELVQKVKEASEFFAQVNVEFPFGDLYTRSVLDQKTRELATVAALTVQGFSLPQLRLHTLAALNCGASREEVLEIVIQMIAYGGFPAATNALLTVKAIFDEIDAKKL